jgi:hypothetical protein
MSRGFACAHFARDLNRTTEPQQLFGQRSFTSIRVGDDGEGAAALYF